MKKTNWPFYLFCIISITVSFFYYFRINLAADTIILFLASKLYLGEWLTKGVFPFFNPHIFTGSPFAFDLGMNNFHPFSLFFMLPFPLSFSVWVGLSTLIFLIGFFLFFKLFTKTDNYALILTLILFFSGSGLIRMTNAIVFSVICHLGLFLYSLSFLKKNYSIKYILFPLVTGVLLTISGHIQIVVYGYLLGLFVMWGVYKVSFKRIVLYFLGLGVLTSWYFVFSIPAILSSTRMTMNAGYSSTGNVAILHMLNFILPFLFGEIHNGSVWNKDVNYQISISLLLSLLPIWLVIKRKVHAMYFVLLCFLILLALGIISIPFLRGAVQSFIPFHIIVLLLLSQHEKEWNIFWENHLLKKLIPFALFIFSMLIIFFISEFFQKLFFALYHILKHQPPSLYYDIATVKAIGVLLAHSSGMLLLSGLFIFMAMHFKRFKYVIIISFVVVEGLFFNYLQSFYIPSTLLTSKPTALNRNVLAYRTQTMADTVPYFGLFTYQENIQMRPPFSKEKPLLTKEELEHFSYLKYIFSFIPSSWSQVANINTVQGYSTFVPKKACEYFKKPSVNWQDEYSYIINKNPLFGTNVENLCINSIETSRITFYDKRWEDLAVRFFISDRPLTKYKLIYKDQRYFYENEKAPPIYGLVKNNQITIKSPYYEDPNQMKFKIQKSEVGKILQIIINPDGFVVEQNKKRITPKTKNFKLLIPLTESGELRVFYSPIEHLRQVLKMNKI